jgi:1-acyl-sn-glycerol-3-phosphate acyltransferase
MPARQHALTDADRELLYRMNRLDRRWTRFLLLWLLRAFFALYGRWQVVGKEHIPRAGRLIFAANHVSYLDPVLGWAAITGTRQVYGIARETLWKNRVVGYLLDSIGAIPVKRSAADRAFFRRAMQVLEQGGAVGIFPEGTRAPDGRLRAAQPGVGFLVQKSHAPVVPVALLGTYEMLPRGRSRLKRAPLKVVVGPPLEFAPDQSREAIGQEIMAALARLLTEHGHPTLPPNPDDRLLPEEESG